MPNKEGFVSVIINCHNSDHYLKEAIQSVYSQSYDKWEIIFWDNASTDSSKKIALSFDDKVRYFYQKDKTNLGTARNRAIQKASGEYIAFLDADDYWHKHKLTNQIYVMSKSKDLAFIYTRTGLVNGSNLSNKTLPKKRSLPSGNIFNKLLKENFIPFPSALIRTTRLNEIGGVPVNLSHSTDYSIFLKLSSLFEVASLNEVLSYYRIHDSNLSKSQIILSLDENIRIISEYKNHSVYLHAYKSHMCFKAYELIKLNRYKEAVLYIFSERLYVSFLRVLYQKLKDKVI